MDDNKTSRRLHEGGARHKQAVEEFFKAQREAKRQGSIGDGELSKELREIEKAAQAQAEKDAAMFKSSVVTTVERAAPPPPPPRPPTFSLSSRPPPPPLPPPPPRPPGVRHPPVPPPHRVRSDVDGWRDVKKEEREVNGGSEDVTGGSAAAEVEGRYTVDGVTFLEGKAVETRLVRGTPCQVWVEKDDAWREAIVSRVEVTAVPNTSLTLRKFSVILGARRPDGGKEAREGQAAVTQGEEEAKEVEEGVLSDRIRLVEGEHSMGGVDTLPPPPPPPPVDEDTGLGGWQTVSVRMVDEEAERKASEAAVRAESKRRKEEDAQRRARMLAEAMEGEDAMSSYDPHGRGIYKGMDLKVGGTEGSGAIVGEVGGAALEVDLGGDQAGPVAFRKRRAGEGKGGGKFRRKRAREDDE